MDNNLENRFKHFLASLPEVKRNELFVTLKKMDAAKREQAVKQILDVYDQRRRAAAAAKAQQQNGAAVKKQNPAGQAVRPQQAKPQQVKPQQIKAPQAKAQPAKQAQQPQVQAKKRNMPHPEKMIGEKPQGVPSNISMLKRNSEPAEDRAAVDETDFAEIREKSSDKKSTLHDLIIVAVILLIFVALCVGIKIFVDKKIKTVETQIESTSTAAEVMAADTTAPEVTEPSETEPTETTPSPTPEPTKVPLAADAPDLSGLKIVIDHGHQAVTSEEPEPISNGSSTMKPRSTSGAVGVTTGVHEYELTLDISTKLKDYLEQCGAEVLLTREENDVDISNRERAEYALVNTAELFIRIHTDAANDSAQSGVKVFVPSSGSYVSNNIEQADKLGNLVAEALGLPYMGSVATDVYAGLNYADTIPSFQISLGMLSNSDDEAILTNEDSQVSACAAIAQFAAEYAGNTASDDAVGG